MMPFRLGLYSLDTEQYDCKQVNIHGNKYQKVKSTSLNYIIIYHKRQLVKFGIIRQEFKFESERYIMIYTEYNII